MPMEPLLPTMVYVLAEPVSAERDSNSYCWKVKKKRKLTLSTTVLVCILISTPKLHAYYYTQCLLTFVSQNWPLNPAGHKH